MLLKRGNNGEDFNRLSWDLVTTGKAKKNWRRTSQDKSGVSTEIHYGLPARDGHCQSSRWPIDATAR
jgi:hypothetical protein